MKEKIIKLRKSGHTYNEISKILNCSKSVISYHCSKMDINSTLIERFTLLKNERQIKNVKKKEIKKRIKHEINDDVSKKSIELFNEGYSYKRISEELNLTVYLVKRIIIKGYKIKRICSVCSNEFEYNNYSKKYCSSDCGKKAKKEYLENKNFNYEKVVDWRIKKKKKSVEYKGGKCIICGYNKAMSALDFHHLDPNKKDFTISKFINKKFENIKDDLDKCVLLCSNCHREVHEGLVNIEDHNAPVV